MANIERAAQAVWTGDLRGGNGEISTNSGALKSENYTWAGRFESAPGTNPEELIAAAHAACYSMALTSRLTKLGHAPQRVITTAFCEMRPKEGGGHEIYKMRLVVRGWVQGIDEQTFRQIAEEADQRCPVSNLLRNGLEIEREVTLGTEDAGLGGGMTE